MKKINKAIVAMMVMAITASPAFAGNNVDKGARPDKKEMRKYDRVHDKSIDMRHRHQARAIEVTTFKVSHRAAKHKNVVAAARAIRGVKDVRWNRHNGMMTVIYDAYKTSPRRIISAVN